MNILYLADPSTESHDSKWMKFFTKEPNRIYLICRKKFVNKIGYPDLEENGIQILGYIKDFSVLRPLATLKSVWYLKKIIQKYNIDIFHILYADPNALWAIFRRSFNCKMGLSTRGSDILVSVRNHSRLINIQDFYVYPLYKKSFMNFNFVTCTSNNQKEFIENITNGSCSPHIIRTGIDIISTDNFSFESGLSGIREKYILFPRSMRPVYNHEFAIRSLQFLDQSVKSSYVFVFLDKNSRDRDYVRQIQQMLDDNIDIKYVFLDRQDQNSLYQLYRNASLIVMTPKSDGSAVTIMEAMAFGIPVILPPLEYDGDLFGDWIYKLKNWDESELAELISTAISEDNSEKLKKAKLIIREKGNREKEMEKLSQLYER